jgi:hypothetical protein
MMTHRKQPETRFQSRLAAVGDATAPRPLEVDDRRARLERWATLLDRTPFAIVGLLPPSWGSGDESKSLFPSPSAIDIAWRDPIFRVTGLASRSRRDVMAFFQLSDAELDRIISGSWRVPLRPSWQVAARIRNVADNRSEKRLLAFTLSLIAVAVGAGLWLT